MEQQALADTTKSSSEFKDVMKAVNAHWAKMTREFDIPFDDVAAKASPDQGPT